MGHRMYNKCMLSEVQCLRLRCTKGSGVLSVMLKGGLNFGWEEQSLQRAHEPNG